VQCFQRNIYGKKNCADLPILFTFAEIFFYGVGKHPQKSILKNQNILLLRDM